MTKCEGVVDECETGDLLRVNFETGLFENLTRKTSKQYVPLDASLLETIAQGGWQPTIEKRIAKMGLI
jgi:hypothetical protein